MKRETYISASFNGLKKGEQRSRRHQVSLEFPMEPSLDAEKIKKFLHKWLEVNMIEMEGNIKVCIRSKNIESINGVLITSHSLGEDVILELPKAFRNMPLPVTTVELTEKQLAYLKLLMIEGEGE